MLKIFIIGVLPSSLINFRGDLITCLVDSGYDVVAMGSGASSKEVLMIEKLGVRYIDYIVQRNGLNPFADLKTLLSFKTIFEKEQPDIILSYTIKPVIWGGIAARFFSRAKFYGLVTGLGFSFQQGDLKQSILNFLVTVLYRFSLSKAVRVIFQNPENMKAFIDHKIVIENKAYRVHGSGVNLAHYNRSDLNKTKPVFLTIARLLGEKGLREYAAAAKLVKEKYPKTIFQLLGPEDPSPDGIPIKEVKEWDKSGIIEYLGEATDVRPFINNSAIFVLASYHEGMPRTVLEAMAIGRPILTTNVPGCKETVINGENGFLVEKENVSELAEKMLWFIENQEQWQNMADKSYEMACDRYDVHKVNEQLMSILELRQS